MASPVPARPLRLTYCGNVHAADDVDGWLAGVATHAGPVAHAARAAGRAFGLGAWWPAPVAQAIATDAVVRARVREALAAQDLALWTLNVFPYAGFHDEVVKTAVYAPDWTTQARVTYTLHCARAAAALVPPASIVPLSTLPLGYRPPGQAFDLTLAARNLVHVAGALAQLRADTGVHCVLALEPEPFCVLETCGQAAQFLERFVLGAPALPDVGEATLRAHLGVCVDLCHLFVVGEDPAVAVTDLRRRAIAVPKVQVSSCLEVRSAAGVPRLLSFDEPRYLHQTVASNGARALDLDGVRACAGDFKGARLRTHFHMPLYWDENGAFGSTRQELERVLPQLARTVEPATVFEVETYTWSVLDAFRYGLPLAQLISAELDFAARGLGAGR